MFAFELVGYHGNSGLVCHLSFLSFAQAAQHGLDKCQQQLSSASTDEARAEAQIGVELYEAVIDALK